MESWILWLLVMGMMVMPLAFRPQQTESEPEPEPDADECEANAHACLRKAHDAWGITTSSYYLQRAQAWALLAQAKRAGKSAEESV